jgi:MoxR-like ATPase
MTQAEALAILKLGVNVFLTGEPGAGKTRLTETKRGL